MKTKVLGLIALGLTNLLIAQNDIALVTHLENDSYSKIEMDDSLKTINSEYLFTISHEGAALEVKKLQNVVAKYNIKDTDVYHSKQNITYTVNFKKQNNSIDVIFNKDGQIISCKEHYEDIRLPQKLSVKIAKQYPNWAFTSVKCNIDYFTNKLAVISYEIIIEKEQKTKLIRLAI